MIITIICVKLAICYTKLISIMQAIKLVSGQCYRLVSFANTPKSYKNRLMAMGITRGVVIQVVRQAPLGCPIQIEVRGISLTLRRADIATIEWEAM
mgnify:FL=1